MPLPVVQKGIIDSVEHREGNMGQEFLSKELERIQKVNPDIAWYVLGYHDGLKNEGFGEAAYCSLKLAISIYLFLESQAEADDMEKDINLG